MNRSEFMDYLLEKGECNRFDEHQIDAIEQFCFALYDNTELDKSVERIAELEKALKLLLEATSYVYSSSAYLSSAEEYAKGLLEKK